MKKILILTLLFLYLLSNSHAQKNYVDSLKQVISVGKQDENQIVTLLLLGNEYKYSSYDSALIYYNEALLLSGKIESSSYKASSLTYIGLFCNCLFSEIYY